MQQFKNTAKFKSFQYFSKVLIVPFFIFSFSLVDATTINITDDKLHMYVSESIDFPELDAPIFDEASFFGSAWSGPDTIIQASVSSVDTRNGYSSGFGTSWAESRRENESLYLTGAVANDACSGCDNDGDAALGTSRINFSTAFSVTGGNGFLEVLSFGGLGNTWRELIVRDLTSNTLLFDASVSYPSLNRIGWSESIALLSDHDYEIKGDYGDVSIQDPDPDYGTRFTFFNEGEEVVTVTLAVPEPSSLFLFLIGLGVLGLRCRGDMTS